MMNKLQIKVLVFDIAHPQIDTTTYATRRAWYSEINESIPNSSPKYLLKRLIMVYKIISTRVLTIHHYHK